VIIQLAVPNNKFGIFSWFGACFIEFVCQKVEFGWVPVWFDCLILLVVGFFVCHLVSPILGVGWLLFSTYLPTLCWRTLSLTYPWTLVSCSSSSSPEHLQRNVLCDYPAAEGVGYWVSKGLCWCVVLNPEYKSTQNHKNQSYVGASIGWGFVWHSNLK